jgi:hypothetical protein
MSISEARDFLRFRRNKVTELIRCGVMICYRMDGVLYSNTDIIKIAKNTSY